MSYNNYDYGQQHQQHQQYNTAPNQGYGQQHQQYYDNDYAQPQAGFMGHGAGSPYQQQNAYNSSSSVNGHGGPGYAASEYASSVYALNESKEADTVPMSNLGNDKMEEKRQMYESPKKSTKKKAIMASAIGGIVVLGAIGFCVYWFAIRKSTSTSSGGGSSSGSAGGGKANAATGEGVFWGRDGSKVTLEDGSTFIYKNPHGGHWYYDPNDPFNNGAKAQSWSPGLNETFNYGVDKMRGVNLGGWFTLEPFISPAPFEKYLANDPSVVDEWHLAVAMRADTAGGGINQLEEHYKTFITEEDFAKIAAAGLNYVRISLPYWAIETRGDEPYLEGVCWKYFLKAIAWARKYGIRINMDLHAVPGSQNGWNHSGRLGEISFLQGPMGYANAQRTLDYIRILAEFAAQPQYRDVITMFGVINEPRASFMGLDTLKAFHAEAYRVVRDATGFGQGPWVSIHDGMEGKEKWAGFLPGADRLMLDTHPYIAFGAPDNRGWGAKIQDVCRWGGEFNRSMAAFGMNNAGEWSAGINDCGLFLNGVTEGVRYDGTYFDGSSKKVGDCAQWTDYQKYTATTKEEIKQFMLGSMDALQNYFFWTWRIGESLASGKVETPAWSYKLGLEEGWMPTDPREAAGACGNTEPWIGPLPTGNGAVVYESYPWPPASINSGGPLARIPSYTATGPLPTLTGATLTVSGVKPTKTVDVGNGWQNPKDTVPLAVEVAGCSYLDPWIGTKGAAPTPLCPGVRKRDVDENGEKRESRSDRHKRMARERREAEAMITAAPTPTPTP